MSINEYSNWTRRQWSFNNLISAAVIPRFLDWTYAPIGGSDPHSLHARRPDKVTVFIVKLAESGQNSINYIINYSINYILYRYTMMIILRN